MTVGERMKKRRKELGFSAEDVAASVGVAPATIYRYEKGEISRQNLEMLEKVAEALHTTAATLMGWDLTGEEQQKKPVTENDDELNSGYYDLTPDNRALIDAMIEKLLKSQSDD